MHRNPLESSSGLQPILKTKDKRNQGQEREQQAGAGARSRRRPACSCVLLLLLSLLLLSPAPAPSCSGHPAANRLVRRLPPSAHRLIEQPRRRESFAAL